MNLFIVFGMVIQIQDMMIMKQKQLIVFYQNMNMIFIIIFYLQTIDEDLTKELFDKMKKELNDNKDKIIFVSVLTKNKIIKTGRQQFVVEFFGLEELKNITLRKINESGLKRVYYKYIKERIILLYKKILIKNIILTYLTYFMLIIIKIQ